MIRFFRHILVPDSLPHGVTPKRMHAFLARVLALFVCFVFTMDAINVDVLYAETQDNYCYQDNPSIVDSQFDTTMQSAIVCSHSQTQSYNLSKVDHHVKFKGAVIYEDIDSPTVLDGASTQTLVASFYLFFVKRSFEEHSVHTTFDRTISYLRLLI